MAITKLTDSSITTGDKYSRFAAENNYFEPIATTLAGSGGVSSITFSSIPQTYTHLQLRGIVRSTSAGTGWGDNVDLRFNGDTGTNYNRMLLQGDGALLAGSTSSSTLVRITVSPRASTTANVFTSFVVDIIDYKNTNKFKQIVSLSGGDGNGSGTVFFIQGYWKDLNAISSISLLPEANNFAQYSRFSLYGVK